MLRRDRFPLLLSLQSYLQPSKRQNGAFRNIVLNAAGETQAGLERQLVPSHSHMSSADADITLESGGERFVRPSDIGLLNVCG